jgi:hypothetical protein
MQRQKVFFFAANIEGSDTIADLEDMRKMAVNNPAVDPLAARRLLLLVRGNGSRGEDQGDLLA